MDSQAQNQFVCVACQMPSLDPKCSRCGQRTSWRSRSTSSVTSIAELGKASSPGSSGEHEQLPRRGSNDTVARPRRDRGVGQASVRSNSESSSAPRTPRSPMIDKPAREARVSCGSLSESESMVSSSDGEADDDVTPPTGDKRRPDSHALESTDSSSLQDVFLPPALQAIAPPSVTRESMSQLDLEQLMGPRLSRGSSVDLGSMHYFHGTAAQGKAPRAAAHSVDELQKRRSSVRKERAKSMSTEVAAVLNSANGTTQPAASKQHPPPPNHQPSTKHALHLHHRSASTATGHHQSGATAPASARNSDNRDSRMSLFSKRPAPPAVPPVMLQDVQRSSGNTMGSSPTMSDPGGLRSPRKSSSPRRLLQTSPRKRFGWGSDASSGHDSGDMNATSNQLQGKAHMLTNRLTWERKKLSLREGTLEVRDYEKGSMTERSTLRSSHMTTVVLVGCSVRPSADKVIAGRNCVLEIATVAGEPFVFSFAAKGELSKWADEVSAAATVVEDTSEAFPGIRMTVVKEEPDDLSWLSMVKSANGWRVELMSTPLDITFASSTKEHSEYQRYFGDHPHTAWVGRNPQGELFIALVAHQQDYSRILLRTKMQDRLVEFASSKSDVKLLKALDCQELYQLSDPRVVKDMDSVGAQNMREITSFKVGVLAYRSGWSELEMLENSHVSKDFEEFLSMLGDKVELQGHSHYAGGLDVSASRSTGDFSLYTRHREDVEIMYHVGPWIPLVQGEKPEARVIQRKRHVGNDYCVIVFLDSFEDVLEKAEVAQAPPPLLPTENVGSTAGSGRGSGGGINSGQFLPTLLKTKYCHMYIVVGKDHEASLNAKTTMYRVAVVLREGMPTFGPRLIRPPLYERGPAFREFLLAKCINGEKASKFAPDFLKERSLLREWFISKVYEDGKK